MTKLQKAIDRHYKISNKQSDQKRKTVSQKKQKTLAIKSKYHTMIAQYMQGNQKLPSMQQRQRTFESAKQSVKNYY